MVRTLFACSVVVLATLTTGCRMCAHPFDYCRPTFTGECGVGCLPNAREGSILSHGIQPVSGVETMVPMPGEVILETGEEVPTGTDEFVSMPKESVAPYQADEELLSGARPILLPQRTAGTWRAVQR